MIFFSSYLLYITCPDLKSSTLNKYFLPNWLSLWYKVTQIRAYCCVGPCKLSRVPPLPSPHTHTPLYWLWCQSQYNADILRRRVEAELSFWLCLKKKNCVRCQTDMMHWVALRWCLLYEKNLGFLANICSFLVISFKFPMCLVAIRQLYLYMLLFFFFILGIDFRDMYVRCGEKAAHCLSA